jgi:CRP/FNR family transcriptional regulator, cyclic AMP receptor protein
MKATCSVVGSTIMPSAKNSPKLQQGKVDAYVPTMLEGISNDKSILTVRRGQTIFSQGDNADAVFFIKTGQVKLTVISAKTGQKAVLALLGPLGLLGEGCLVGQSRRANTATSVKPSTLFRVAKAPMRRALLKRPELSEKFIRSLLLRNIALQRGICDQLLNHSEKRLARVLLKLTRLSTQTRLRDAKVQVPSHKALAKMVGTTSVQIAYLMRKFRKLGLIAYNGELTIKTGLLTNLVLD